MDRKCTKNDEKDADRVLTNELTSYFIKGLLWVSFNQCLCVELEYWMSFVTSLRNVDKELSIICLKSVPESVMILQKYYLIFYWIILYFYSEYNFSGQ